MDDNDCETCGGLNGQHDATCIWHPQNVRIRELEQEISDLKNPNKWPKQWKGKVPLDGNFLLKVGVSFGLEGKNLGRFMTAFKDQPFKFEVNSRGMVSLKE
jgi:hypothetical protein